MSSTNSTNDAQGNNSPRLGSPSNNAKPLFIVKKIESVALWSWKRDVQNCGICKCTIQELCLDCQTISRSERDRYCPRSVGRCKHVFHTHCINTWINQNESCPLCNRPWPAPQKSQGADAAGSMDAMDVAE